MISLALNRNKIDDAVRASVNILKKGGVIAYPTETFYALGVEFNRFSSLKKLNALKKRPREKALPMIIGSIATLSAIVSPEWLSAVPPFVLSLTDRFWPGPLTLLMPARKGLPECLTADTGMIAVRMPGESFALHLARHAGFPITATSANLSGSPPADRAEMVSQYFGDELDLVIDGGKTPGGLPSTIVDVSGDKAKIAREGVIRRDEIEGSAS